MQTFINNILSFIKNIYDCMSNGFRNPSIFNENEIANYSSFLAKNIFNGTLININLTYRELIIYVSSWTITILFIIFIFKLVSGVIRFFFIGN